MVELKQRLANCLAIKEKNFGKKIIFSCPQETIAVAATGKDCSLGCAHCNGHYLEGMTILDDLEKKLKSKNVSSLLLSGGCDPDGQVGLIKHLDKVKELKNRGFKLNSHVGLMKEEYIKMVAPYIDVISFDLILDEETIKEVYRLDKKPEDYIKTYELLCSYKTTIPHILVGIHGGKIKGEYKILEYLEQNKPEGITFIVLIPTRGTDYENVAPPAIEEVANLLCTAREKFQDIPINLGCMRPTGEYRRALDMLALQAGINNIVMPAKNVIAYTKEQNWEIVRNEECCVLC